METLLGAVLILLGSGIILTSAVDMVTTTLAVGGAAGPVTTRIASTLWDAACRRRHGRERAMQAAGIAIVVSVIAMWTLSAWVGWSLLFNVAPGAVVSTASGVPAGGFDRIYFAGYTLLTLGNGDFRPVGAVWQLATVVAAANGLVYVTLAISYLVPVVSAATQKRQIAAYISSLGATPAEILVASWDGSSFKMLEDHLIGMSGTLHLLEQRHLAYPVLHYFHSPQPRTAAALRIAALDEALTILRVAVHPDAWPRRGVFTPLRRSLRQFFATLEHVFVAPAREPPPRPPLDALRQAGVPLCSEEQIAAGYAPLRHHRQLVRGFVEHDGWTWERVLVSDGDDTDGHDMEDM